MHEGKAKEDKTEELRTWVSTARLHFGGKPKTACVLSVKVVPLLHFSKECGPSTPSTNETNRAVFVVEVRCVFGVRKTLVNKNTLKLNKRPRTMNTPRGAIYEPPWMQLMNNPLSCYTSNVLGFLEALWKVPQSTTPFVCALISTVNLSMHFKSKHGRPAVAWQK